MPGPGVSTFIRGEKTEGVESRTEEHQVSPKTINREKLAIPPLEPEDGDNQLLRRLCLHLDFIFCSWK